MSWNSWLVQWECKEWCQGVPPLALEQLSSWFIILPSQFVILSIPVYAPKQLVCSTRLPPSRPVTAASQQVAILGNPDFWKKKESQTNKEQPHMWLSKRTLEQFEPLFLTSSIIIIDYQSHIIMTSYRRSNLDSKLQFLEIQSFERRMIQFQLD